MTKLTPAFFEEPKHFRLKVNLPRHAAYRWAQRVLESWGLRITRFASVPSEDYGGLPTMWTALIRYGGTNGYVTLTWESYNEDEVPPIMGNQTQRHFYVRQFGPQWFTLLMYIPGHERTVPFHQIKKIDRYRYLLNQKNLVKIKEYEHHYDSCLT